MLITEAIQTLRKYSRDLISVELADEVVKAFPYEDPRMYGLVESLAVQRDEGFDLSERVTIYESGPSVAVYLLAMGLASIFNPDFEYPRCPYSGTGRRVDWYTNQACLALEEVKLKLVNWRPSSGTPADQQ